MIRHQSQFIKLLIRLAVMGLAVVAVVTAVSAVHLRSFQSRDKQYAGMPDQIEVCNTGSSHGASAFVYDDIGYTGFNFAMGSQSIQYDYNLIHYYKDKLSPGAVVLVSISYPTPWNEEMELDSFDSKNLRYFNILDIDHLRLRNRRDYYINKYFDIINVADRRIRSIFASRAAMELKAMDNDTTTAVDRTEEDGHKRALYHMRWIYEDGIMLPCREDNLRALHDLLRLCREQGFKPVLVTTPLMEIYYKWFDQAFLDQFYEVVEQARRRYDVPYLDYSRDERISPNIDFFLNEDHLNGEGARAFTEIVIHDLEALGLLPGTPGSH